MFNQNYFIMLELGLFIFFNILIFIKTDSIAKTFISLFQIFPPLLILFLTKYKNINNITFYTTVIFLVNFLIQLTVILLIRRISEINKTDRNFRPDEYDK